MSNSEEQKQKLIVNISENNGMYSNVSDLFSTKTTQKNAKVSVQTLETTCDLCNLYI